jgi:hypothetical protein
MPNATATVLLSTNSTLYWRLFVPIFSTVILTAMLLVLWLTDDDELYFSIHPMYPRLIALAVWITWIWLMYRTLWRLKRIDASAAHLYVTDYWTNVRYPWAEVEKVETVSRLGRKITQIHLIAPGRFGQKISFLPAKNMEEWLRTHVSL